MLLGVVLHAAAVFSENKYWLIYHNSPYLYADSINEAIYLFRMPTFFTLAGFFAALSLKKHNTKSFIKLKFFRIGLPLISSVLLLNSVQILILNNTGWLSFNLNTYFEQSLWKGHLWFLINLLVYFVFSALTYHLIEKFILKYKNKNIYFPPPILLFLLPMATIVLLASHKIGIPIYKNLGGVFTVYELIYYAQFFCFGIALYHSQLTILPSNTWLFLCLALAITANLLFKNHIIIEYFSQLKVWCCIFICISLFKQFFNKPFVFIQPLINASYSIYLFHHVIVIAFGLLLIKLNIGGGVGFILLIILTGITSLIIHQKLIMKYRFLTRLFNGK